MELREITYFLYKIYWICNHSVFVLYYFLFAVYIIPVGFRCFDIWLSFFFFLHVRVYTFWSLDKQFELLHFHPLKCSAIIFGTFILKIIPFCFRTSVLFVSITFIVLMIISLTWLVFYYVQRFRYIRTKDKLTVSTRFTHYFGVVTGFFL